MKAAWRGATTQELCFCVDPFAVLSALCAQLSQSASYAPVLCCCRFQQWAFGDGGMREIWANLPQQGQSLFPLLRSTSDLLMMPKDLLLEEGIRADLCDSVSAGRVCISRTGCCTA